MTGNEYQKAAMRTAGTLDKKALLINGVMGLNGEAGECIDLVKKHLFQGHTLDLEHVAMEISDCLWYCAVTAYAVGYTLDEIFEMNVQKLLARYPDGFDAKRSLNRLAGDK